MSIHTPRRRTGALPSQTILPPTGALGGSLALPAAANRFIAGLLILAGLAWPFVVVHGIGSYSVWDLAVFETWADCWGEAIYRDCQPNYPAVGLMLSAGVMHLIDAVWPAIDRETARLLFRDYLAIFDASNFLLFIWIAVLMRLRWPIAVALLLVLMPSTWVGGAHWGQIDNIGLFFCLLSAIGFVKCWQALGDHRDGVPQWRLFAWPVIAMLNLAFYLLSKQLAIFSVPFYLLLALMTLRLAFARRGWSGLAGLLPGLAVFLLAFVYLDTSFRVPDGFHRSSYWYVWAGGGSDHANQISRNGFNVWTFLGRDMESSSHVNFLNFQIWKWRDHLSPYKAGMILYFLFVAGLLAVSVKRWWGSESSAAFLADPQPQPGLLMALLFLFHGLCHLGFNVLLSGTHERYLYLGYPFLLLAAAWFSSRQIFFGGRLTAFCFLAAAAYGGFVFGINGQLSPLLFPLRRPEFLASLHLFLLVVLADRYGSILKQALSGLPSAAPAIRPAAVR